MSLPIAQVALIRTAAQLATSVASRVGSAVRFDEILAGPESNVDQESGLTSPQASEEARQKLIDTVRGELAKHRIDVKPGVELNVQADGTLQVASDHPRGAEIEAVLRNNPSVIREAIELVQVSGSNEISIDLTSSGVAGNMFAPGGYPNW